MRYQLFAYCVGYIAFVQVIAKEFEDLIGTSTFVDKSLFIKTYLENENFTLITAPPKSGKTTIVKMLKKFLEIEVERDGQPVTRLNYLEEQVTDTKNYDLFKKHDLAINMHPECFSEHFGRTPVIFVDFELNHPGYVVECLHDAVRVVKDTIHHSFKKHEYLIHSDRLTDDHKNYVRMWCEEHSYKTMIDTLYVSHALQSLSQYLCSHFNGTKVFVIVDNYDVIIRNAMCSGKDAQEVTKIVNYVVGVMRDVLKDNEDNVRGALITGVSDFPFLNKTYFNDCFTYSFLGDHVFLDYFGFTRKDIVSLFSKSKLYVNSKTFESYYSGYQSIKGVPIYNMFSTLSFLKTGLYGSYFASTTFPNHLKKILKVPIVEETLESLLQNKTLAMEIPLNTRIDNVVHLYKSTLEPSSNNDLPSLFLNSLFEWGFLTFDPLQESFLNDIVVIRNFVGVKLPNLEIREFLEKQINSIS